MNTENNIPPQAEREIDLLELAGRLWVKRRFILCVTAVFMVLGLLAGVFGAKEYAASCQIVPQTSRSGSSSSMARLASLAGINMGNMTSNEQVLSPLVYPNVMASVAFQRELLQTPINVAGEAGPVTLLSYLSDEKHRRFSLAGFVLKYTIGLPGLVMRAIKGEPEEREMPQSDIIVLSREERLAMRQLKNIIGMEVEEKKGYITIVARMPEAFAAAQVAESALTLLQRYITEFKIDKVKRNLDFIQGRYDELKREYEDIQMIRARYRDANQNTIRYSARTEQEKLDAEYSRAMNLYSELATQLEQAKISVKETTPILTVVNPVTVPYRKSKPNRPMIVIAFTFFGVIVGAGVVLFLPLLGEISGSDRWRRFVKELPAKSASTSGADAEK